MRKTTRTAKMALRDCMDRSDFREAAGDRGRLPVHRPCRCRCKTESGASWQMAGHSQNACRDGPGPRILHGPVASVGPGALCGVSI